MSNVQRVVDWLNDNPGYFRPRDMAKAVGLERHQTAMTLRYLYEQGRIDRIKEGYYGAPDGVLPQQNKAWPRKESA